MDPLFNVFGLPDRAIISLTSFFRIFMGDSWLFLFHEALILSERSRSMPADLRMKKAENRL